MAISVMSVTALFNTLFQIDLTIYSASDVVFCGWKIVEDYIFSVFLSISCVTPFLNNDHLNTLDACKDN